MSPEEFKESVILICNSEIIGDDTELRHIALDNLMCDVLIDLGYRDGVELFRKADKWYS